MAHTLFITGANRGLGLEFVRQYAIDGWQVIASCRDPVEAKALESLKKNYANISIIKLIVYVLLILQQVELFCIYSLVAMTVSFETKTNLAHI